MASFAPLASARLFLRPYAPTDAAELERNVSDWRVARYTTHIPHPYPAGAAPSFIADVNGELAAGGGYTLAIVEQMGAAMVGAIRLDLDEDDPAAGGIGYWIARSRWGRGYATEAARRIVRFGFQDLGLARIRSHVMPDNAASRRVLEKAGLRVVGHGPVAAPARGGAVVMAHLLLERAAWRPDG